MNVTPAALEAMQRPILGHLDPDFHEILPRSSSFSARSTEPARGLVLPLQATGMSGMETGLVNLLEPGDVAIVGASGFFGRRIAEVARLTGATVVEVEAELGEHVPNARLMDALDAHPGARLLAVVHAETSTGVRHPLAELGELMRERDTLLMADCVTSLGGIELEFDTWGIDYAYSCTQKCLAAPPGMSPLAVSERAMDRVRTRTTPVPFSFDLRRLADYWVKRPIVYHHTCPILHIYALHAALREVLLEGLEVRWARHAQAGAHLQSRASRARHGVARRRRPSAPAADGGPRPRRDRRHVGSDRACSVSTGSRSAAGSVPARHRSGGSA